MPEQRVLQDTVGAVVRTHTGKPRGSPRRRPSQSHLVLLRYPVRRCVSRSSVRRAAPLQPLLSGMFQDVWITQSCQASGGGRLQIHYEQ